MNHKGVKMLKQATAVALFSMALLSGQVESPAPAFAYVPPVVKEVVFGDAVMLEQERRSYATNLATYAANLVVMKKASKESLASARRILALAFHLERRNKQAVVVNFQLREGVLPEVKKGDYNPRTFSRLLMARAKLLLRGDGENVNERLLGRCFIEMAAHMDPRNEDAVFEHESQRIDSGELDWGLLTDGRKESSGAEEAPEG